MAKRSLLSAIGCFISVLILYAGSNDYTTDNVVIADQASVFTIHEKNGVMTDVTEERTTTYTANRVDDTAIEVVMYNSDIAIDKASAPGTKPYYGSWEDEDAFYSGARICGMAIPVKAGKSVKSSYKRTFRKPEQFCNFIIPSSYFKLKSDYIIKVPAALAEKIKVEGFNLAEGMKLSDKKESDGSVTYILTCVGVAPWKHEYRSPSASVAAPQLVITGCFEGVGDLYKYFRGFIDDNDGGDENVRKMASDLRAKADTPLALIDSTAQWVRRNIRYLAVEHGEYAFRPFSSSEVLAHRAGDCKGSANLIKTLLKLNGLDGRLVWVGTKGDIPFDWDKVPALCSGNHVVAACVLPDTIIYIDGTTEWASPGYVPHTIRDRQVIVEDGENYLLTRIPDRSRTEDISRFKANFRIEENDLLGSATYDCSGISRMQLLSAYSAASPRDREERLCRILRYPRKNTDVEDVSLSYDAKNPSAILTGILKERNAVKTIGSKMYVDLKPMRDGDLESIETKGRRHDFLFPYDYESDYSYEVKIPEGWEVASLPDEMAIKSHGLDACLRYESGDGIIRCEVRVVQKPERVPKTELEGYAKEVKNYLKASDSQMVLIKK